MTEIKQTYQQLEQELEVWRHGPSCWSCGDSGDVHQLDGEWLGKCNCLAAQLIEVKAENERLKGLQPGYPPRPPDGDGLPRYGLRWNGPQQPLATPMDDGYWTPWHLAEQLKAENEALAEKYEAARDRKNSITALQVENEVARMRIKELDLLFGRYLLGMRAAVIDEEVNGQGMRWIYNALAGPGELPPEGEENAQAYFDREIVAVDNGMQEVMAFHEARCIGISGHPPKKKTGD